MAAQLRRTGPSRWRRRLVSEAIVLAGLAGLVLAVYFAVVLGVGRVPGSEQRKLLLFSMVAAAVTALIWTPLRARLSSFAARLVHSEPGSPGEVLRTFGIRLTQVVPPEELLLQLCESLRATLRLDSAEVWTGSGGVLERVASDPEAGGGSLILSSAEEGVVARAGVRGKRWLTLWVPQLVVGREQAALRAAPITHAGELLGLVVVERRSADEPFGEEDELVLGELARQLGLALRNVRLGSALEASLAELQVQAEELRASRARVVAAGDIERQRIERDLHDGAQQHLLGVAVKLRLARELASVDPNQARSVLEELSGEVHHALEELRHLAQGIYPPVLRDRGLGEGLRAAVARARLSARVETGTFGRYGTEIEATVYFCCLEALQNARKHAGEGACATVRVWETDEGLHFEVADDGVGFELGRESRGAGLTNMSDRIAALGGRLSVRSTPAGTRVAGVIPLKR
jgi:signal transduction histidine kinase